MQHQPRQKGRCMQDQQLILAILILWQVRKTSVKADFTYTGVNNFTNLTGFSLHKTAAAESTKCSCQKEVKGNNSCSSGTR